MREVAGMDITARANHKTNSIAREATWYALRVAAGESDVDRGVREKPKKLSRPTLLVTHEHVLSKVGLIQRRRI
jgi:hypothetical protein